MKRSLLFIWLLFVTGVNAQTPGPTASQQWRRYTVKEEKFAVDLPAFPELSYEKVRAPLGHPQPWGRLQMSFGSYADGVIYTVVVLENVSQGESLDTLIKKKIRNQKTWNLSDPQEVQVEEISGKAFRSVEPNLGMVQFFSKGNRLFQFMAFGAAVEDPRMTQLFSSITLTRKKGSLDMSDRSVRAKVMSEMPVPPPSDPNEKIFTAKEVEKKVRLGFKPEPRYTEEARQDQVTGTVILKAVFAPNGTITNISVVRGLPRGLTERAIAAARMMKFIPAMKDGRYVPVWMQLEYSFNLY
jgi:TonB family protein